MHVIQNIITERPLGTQSNKKVCDLLKSKATKMDYDVKSIKFDCNLWEKEVSYVEISKRKLEIFPSPFSKPFIGEGELIAISTIEGLEEKNIANKIVLLKGDLTKQPLQPKNFPFYYPEEHKLIIDLLENKKTKAIIAITGKHPMCGLNPFPLFEDGNFSIPSAYTDDSIEEYISGENEIVQIQISSNTKNTSGCQFIFQKKGNYNGKIVVCAHMDSKYGTKGAIDNATGVEVLFCIMEILKSYNGYNVDFVPFNGEEYYGVNGQLEYLKFIENQKTPIKLVINIDSPGHKDSKTAISTYNFNDSKKEWISNEIQKNNYVVEGSEWYAGDHAMFVFQGVPCIAVTSSNLFETVLDLTHTPNDIIDNVNEKALIESSVFLSHLIRNFKD